MNASLLAPWSTALITVASGAGGNITVPITVPLGQIWRLVYATASHEEAINARLIQHRIDSVVLPGEATVLVSVRVSAPLGTYLAEPIVLSYGGMVYSAYFTAMGAAVNCNLRIVVQKFFGVSPLI